MYHCMCGSVCVCVSVRVYDTNFTTDTDRRLSRPRHCSVNAVYHTCSHDDKCMVEFDPSTSHKLSAVNYVNS